MRQYTVRGSYNVVFYPRDIDVSPAKACVIVPVPAKFGCNKIQRTQIVMLNCVCELFTRIM